MAKTKPVTKKPVAKKSATKKSATRKSVKRKPVENAATSVPRVDTERVVREAAASYIADCRARVSPFIDRHFSLRGSARLHRIALGWDILRAPINLVLIIPNILRNLASAWFHRVGKPVPWWLDGRDLHLPTAVNREVEWLVLTELMEAPARQTGRSSGEDALSDAIRNHPDVREITADRQGSIAKSAISSELATRLTERTKSYTRMRSAAAEVTTALASMAIGVLVFGQLTPSALSLGPSLAEQVAHDNAVADFPLGTDLGGAWYGLFPPEPSTDLVVWVTVGLLFAVAVAGAFAGIVADPFQRLFGLHQRRLEDFVNALEVDLTGGRSEHLDADAAFAGELVDCLEFASEHLNLES